jgi:hypothetical protein
MELIFHHSNGIRRSERVESNRLEPRLEPNRTELNCREKTLVRCRCWLIGVTRSRPNGPPMETTKRPSSAMIPAMLCGVVSSTTSSEMRASVTGLALLEAMTRCGRAVTLAVFALPLGVCAHVAAVMTLPGRLCAACARETAMVLRRRAKDGGGDGDGDDDEGEVRAMMSGLWAVATKPTLALACAREVKEDAEILRDLRRKTEEAIEGYKSVSATEREKFEAACVRLAEEERARERLREQLTTTREELKRERQRAMARDGTTTTDRGVGTLYVTTAMLGVMLLYFHDIDEVHNVDKKIAMLVPAFWMFVMTFKTQSAMRLCAMLNLIGFGYFAHIVLSHKRALGAVTRTVVA